MERFPESPLPDLEWIQTVQGFELRAGEPIYATLQFEYGFFALGATADQRWSFNRKGWFKKRVIVRREVEDDVVAVMPLSGTREGTLLRPDGDDEFTALLWSGCTWDTEDDWVVRYHNTSGFDTHQARVELDPGIMKLPELPLLVVLGWYLVNSNLMDAQRAD